MNKLWPLREYFYVIAGRHFDIAAAVGDSRPRGIALSRRLEGKVALITGAAGDIGAASARLFANEGAALIVTDLEQRSLCQLQAELQRSQHTVFALAGDLTDESFVSTLMEQSAERYGGLDILYNNAGVMVAGSIDRVTASDLSAAFAVNLIAQAMTAKYAAAHMRKRGGGAIVNTASMGGLLGFSGMIAYTASKAAVIGATRSLAMELSRDRIRVNAIAPGVVDTQMPRKLLQSFSDEERSAATESFYSRQLMKRFAAPQEIAQAVLFLSSDEASFITGVILPVDGGWSCW